MKTTTAFAKATEIARANQPDAEIAAQALEDHGFSRGVARRALRAAFGYDVLAA